MTGKPTKITGGKKTQKTRFSQFSSNFHNMAVEQKLAAELGPMWLLQVAVLVDNLVEGKPAEICKCI